MSSLIIAGDTSGQIAVAAPAVAGTNTLTLQAGTGTNSMNILNTAIASTSGTTIDFTSIPSWVKRITIMFNEVSQNATSIRLVQLGTGSTTYTTSGYLATSSVVAATVATTSSAAGFVIYQDNAAYACSGHMILTNVSGNIWISSHTAKLSTALTVLGGGSLTLGAPLTAVRITTVNGTDLFDAGSVNLLYEG